MVAFMLSQENLPYAISLSLVLLFGLLESLSLVVGASLVSLLQSPEQNESSPFNPELKQASYTQAHINPSRPLLRFASWLCIHRLPVLIWFSLALSSFAIAGFVVNLVSLGLLMDLQPQYISLPVALLAMILSCHFFGKLIADRLSTTISNVVSIEDLNGCIAKIGFARAQQGFPGAAIVVDKHRQEHQVFVEPITAGTEFLEGTSVVLVNRRGRVWQALPIEADCLAKVS
ncbi:OB-fold-containig protein [Shewanella pneumatophori]|uniref:YqiJ family protein n=1 Tax=Shewanella pneumatophori TaxID=314092 RepID=A0A9X1ZF62_9GAMM|nr:OB-fold-containig protein [Shewanella pneumatophori]MCL1138772.1 YqiJ family protein [Shewanella pneumatophori]